MPYMPWQNIKVGEMKPGSRAKMMRKGRPIEMTLRPNNKKTVEEKLSSQVTYGYWSGEAIGLDSLRAKTQRELE